MVGLGNLLVCLIIGFVIEIVDLTPQIRHDIIIRRAGKNKHRLRINGLSTWRPHS